MDLLFKTLGEAQVMAPRSATLTWINDQVGASVSQGSNLAILSDLSSFKVEGEIADSYADKITAGTGERGDRWRGFRVPWGMSHLR